MPDFDAFKGGYWTDGDIQYLQTLGLSADQIRNIVETYPDGPASAGISVPSNNQRGQDWTGQYYEGGGTVPGPQAPPPPYYPKPNWTPDPRNGTEEPPPPTNPYTPSAFNLTDPTAFFDEKFIQQYFNTGRGNLSAMAGSVGSQAATGAAQQAAQRGLLNPGAFVGSQRSAATSPYAGAFGQLEQGRAGALQQNQQGLFGALNNKALMEEQVRAAREKFDFTKATDQRDYEQMVRQFTQNWDLQNRQFNLQSKQYENSGANWMDFLGLGFQALPFAFPGTFGMKALGNAIKG